MKKQPKSQPGSKQVQPTAEFGGGAISPSVRKHVEEKNTKQQQPAPQAKPKSTMGGGAISPSVRKHVGK